MKKLLIACVLAVLTACNSTGLIHRGGQPQLDRTITPVGQPPERRVLPPETMAPRCYTVFLKVSKVDTVSWTAYCTDEAGQVYAFEVDDEYNEGDNVRAVISDGGTISQRDDYIIRVHY